MHEHLVNLAHRFDTRPVPDDRTMHLVSDVSDADRAIEVGHEEGTAPPTPETNAAWWYVRELLVRQGVAEAETDRHAQHEIWTARLPLEDLQDRVALEEVTVTQLSA